MSILLALASAAAPAAGSNIGGVFASLKGVVSYNRVKLIAKDNAISKDDAEKAYDALKSVTAFTTVADYDKEPDGLKDDVYTIKVDFSKLDNNKDDDKKSAAETLRKEFNKALASGRFKSVRVVAKLLTPPAVPPVAPAVAPVPIAFGDLFTQDALKGFRNDDSRKSAVEKRVLDDAEQKFTATTGGLAIDLGYLHKFNHSFGLGALVEGVWLFPQDLKLEGVKEKDFAPRFGVNGYVRAVYFATPKFFFGADVGVGAQEFRWKNPANTGKSDSKDSKWGYNLRGGILAGVSINDNFVVTAKVGGGIPVKDQDWKERNDRKFRYYDVQGTLGVSYYLGA